MEGIWIRTIDGELVYTSQIGIVPSKAGPNVLHVEARNAYGGTMRLASDVSYKEATELTSRIMMALEHDVPVFDVNLCGVIPQ